MEKRKDCDAKHQKDGSMYCPTCNLTWDADDKDPPECRSVPTRTQYPKGCSTPKARDVLPLSHFEQYALAALGVTPFTLLHDVKRVELRQGDKHVTLYETHPEHMVQLVDGELYLLRQGEAYTVSTVDYSSVQDLSVKLQTYKAQHFYGNPDKGNNMRAAENFVDWVRNGNSLTYCKGTTWLDFIFAVRTCDYTTALRRSYGVKDVTLTKLPNTQKLCLP